MRTPILRSTFLMDSPMEFWGVEIKVGQSVKVDPNEKFQGYIHISQIALGEVKKGKASEPVVVSLKVDGQKIVLGTLNKDDIPHITLDLVLNQETELSHSSKSAAVYFSGYRVYSNDVSDGFDYSDSDEEPAPLKENAQPVKEAAKSGKPTAETAASTKQVKIVDPEKHEDESDDESDSDYSEDDLASDDEIDADTLTGSSDEETPAKKIDTDTIDSDSDTDSEEETPAKKTDTESGESESESEQDATPNTIDADSTDTDSDTDSDEETPAKKVVIQGKNNKRGIGAGSQTPVPAKKAKNGTPEKTSVHVATPYPGKQGGKFHQNAAKGQSSNSSKSGASKNGQQNKKSKQSRR